MSWGLWSRKPAEPTATTSLIGLDLDARRACAVHGPVGDPTPKPLKLDAPHDELPLVISLENRAPEVGRAGVALVRKTPHLTISGYLATLGQPREWRNGRLRVDPTGAAILTAERIRAAVVGTPAVGVALPVYLSPQQITLATAALEHVRLGVLGTIAPPLAVAAVTPDRFRTVLFGDADDHALTWTVLTSDGGQARSAATLALPHLSSRVWLDRLLDATADRCVRLCRRDPRDSATAEQYLYEQLAAALDRPSQPTIPLTIRTANWYQELTLSTDDLVAFGLSLGRKATEGLRGALEQAQATTPKLAEPDGIWLTHNAARLPGLKAAIDAIGGDVGVKVLPADFVARAVHGLAGLWHAGELPRGHVETLVPRFGTRTMTNGSVPPPAKAEAGPPAHMNPLVRVRDMLRRPGQS